MLWFGLGLIIGMMLSIGITIYVVVFEPTQLLKKWLTKVEIIEYEIKKCEREIANKQKYVEQMLNNQLTADQIDSILKRNP